MNWSKPDINDMSSGEKDSEYTSTVCENEDSAGRVGGHFLKMLTLKYQESL